MMFRLFKPHSHQSLDMFKGYLIKHGLKLFSSENLLTAYRCMLSGFFFLWRHYESQIWRFSDLDCCGRSVGAVPHEQENSIEAGK